MKLSRLRMLFFLHLQHLPMPSRKWRPLFCKLGGVNILDYKNTFIGENVTFDTNYPYDITIEKGVRLTAGCRIVTHFMESSDGKYSRGKVYIGENAYLGMNTLVIKPISIGANSIIGAGSLVTKNIPAYEVCAGNPAKFLKKRKFNE